MARIRYVRVVGVALAVAAFSMIGIVLGDAKLAEAAGLDVWNVGRLEDLLRMANVKADRLEVQLSTSHSQNQVNQSIVQDVINGKRRLLEAADQLWTMNQHTPSYVHILPGIRQGPTIVAKVAHNIMVVASQELRCNPVR